MVFNTNMNLSKLKLYYKPYWLLVLLRILLVFIPQHGYIHPDEYFQSIEVLTGQIFDLQVNEPWEYNVTFPLRSVGVNYFTIGASYRFLKIVDALTKHFLQKTVITPYFLLVLPRLVMCLCTFITDYTLFKLCVNNNEKYKSRILILATSYVILIYGTRTFSNTFELVFFSILLYYVADSMTFSTILIKQQEYLNKRYEKSRTNLERAKIHKLRMLLSPYSLRNCLQVSTITVIGFFNRPTFLAFAVCPVFFWLYRGIGFKSVASMQFHYRIFILLLSSIPTIILFIVIDSFYYGYLSLAEIEFFTVNINNFVFTPLNFLKYNVDKKNLAVHGLHPHYLHLTVNLPLLFNILVAANLYGFVTFFQRFIKCQYHYLPTIRSIRGLMTASLIAPVLILSIFEHQEPRFLIPLIVPLVYLNAHDLFPDPHNIVVATSKQIAKPANSEKKPENPRHLLFKIWLVLNVILSLFYGFIHQGGVFKATSYLSEELNSKPINTNFHVVTSHIYSMPKSLFLQKSSEKLYYNNKFKYKLNKRLFMYEEGSNNLLTVLKTLEILRSSSNRTVIVYFVFPNSLKVEIDYNLNNIGIKLENCVSFFPHVSTEALPTINSFVPLNFSNFSVTFVSNFVKELYNTLSIKICTVELIVS